jgi:Flp pilus assembly protein TadD
VVLGAALGVRVWNALAGPLMWGYDAWAHVAYALFLDLYRALPWADQGWSYYQPPLHYALGWALAQPGSGELLMRGLSLAGSAASLGVAGLSAWVTHAVAPGRPMLALVAFAAAAFLPVQIFVSPMPGNELSVALLSTAAIAVFIANERRQHPGLLGDAATGALLSLALLTKYTGIVPLLAVLAALGLRPLFSAAPSREQGREAPAQRGGAERRRAPAEQGREAPAQRGGAERRRAPAEIPRALARAALVAVVVLALAGPLYARNLRGFGEAFPSNSDFPLVGDVEAAQPPGFRSWRDYLALSPLLFVEPEPRAPHLLHSVWGTLYLNVWADTYRETDVAGGPKRLERRAASWMALLGLAPTALALAGALLAARDVWRGRRRAVYAPLLLLCAVMLAAFVRFTWGVPTWAALKASYCLSLSLPYAVFVARSVEALVSCRAAWQRTAAGTALAVVSLAACLVGAEGAVLPRRADAPATGAVRFYFGEYDQARRVYGRMLEGAPYKVPWLDNLAAVELADGQPRRARKLYARAESLARAAGRGDPQRLGRLAVAVALDGDSREAGRLLDVALEEAPLAELLANRGAVRAALGEPVEAERDLRAALEANPEMVPAWRNLARVLELSGSAAEAERARRRAADQACRGPRGYPYGVGTGEILEWGVGRRWLLLLGAERRQAPAEQGREAPAQRGGAERRQAPAEAEGRGTFSLRAALPSFYREACASAVEGW